MSFLPFFLSNQASSVVNIPRDLPVRRLISGVFQVGGRNRHESNIVAFIESNGKKISEAASAYTEKARNIAFFMLLYDADLQHSEDLAVPLLKDNLRGQQALTLVARLRQ